MILGLTQKNFGHGNLLIQYYFILGFSELFKLLNSIIYIKLLFLVKKFNQAKFSNINLIFIFNLDFIFNVAPFIKLFKSYSCIANLIF